MLGSAEDLGIWKKKKTVSWDLNSERVSWDSSLEEGSQFLVLPRRDQLESTKCAVRLLKKLCLSLLMSKNLKLKKVNKSFIPEPKESRQVFRVFFGFFCLWTFVKVFPYPYEYVYFTCSYLGRFRTWICYISCSRNIRWVAYFFIIRIWLDRMQKKKNKKKKNRKKKTKQQKKKQEE